MTKLRRQLFIFEQELISSCSEEEVSATYRDMLELGIANPPCEDFDIIVPASSIMSITEESSEQVKAEAKEKFVQWKIKFSFKNEQAIDWFMDKNKGQDWWSLDEISELASEAPFAFDGIWKLLIVTLATKNINKEIKQNKAAKLGIGRAAKNGYEYTTIIRPGHVTETHDGRPIGTHDSPRPHLRRGHIRRQHHGHHNSETKQIFIQPTFVNVDQTFINQRTAYRLRK